MKKMICSALFLVILSSTVGQKFEYVYRNPADSSFNCYLKFHPQTKNIKGLVVRDYSKLYDANEKSPYAFTDLCLKAGLMVLITNSSNQFPELFISEEPMKILDEMIHEVVQEHKIPKDNIFIGGISASGTRALRYAQYCASGNSSLKMRGVFVVDSPLDLARFYNSAFHHKMNFSDGMLWEANIMIPFFEKIFGGGPDKFAQEYKKASVFTHLDSLGGNAHLLKNTDLIIFHEPDLDWWMSERGCSYYDLNSFDLAAFTVFLRKLGNPFVELITTTGKGKDKQGNRKPHSWTIVDEGYLVDWMQKRLNQN